MSRLGVVHVSLKTQGNKMADIGSWLLVYIRLYSGSLFFFFVGDLFLVELNDGII